MQAPFPLMKKEYFPTIQELMRHLTFERIVKCIDFQDLQGHFLEHF